MNTDTVRKKITLARSSPRLPPSDGGEDDTPDASTRTPRAARDLPLPLGHAQLCFWFIYATIGETANNLVHLELDGALDVTRLERALELMIERHDVLRMRIGKWRPMQVRVSACPFDLRVQDLGALGEAERDGAIARLSKAFLSQPFDLNSPPLLRARLLRLAPQRHLLLLCFPHIAADGASVHLFERQLLDTYDRLEKGTPARARDSALQIGEYALWEREQCDIRGATAAAFWRRELRGHPYATWPREHLAIGGPTPMVHYLPLPDAVLEAWASMARAHKATFQMCVLAAIALAVRAITGQPRFALNSVLESREHAQTEGLMGPLLRIMPIPFDMNAGAAFPQTLAAVRQHSIAAYEHMTVPWSMPLGLLAEQRWDVDASVVLRKTIAWGSALFHAIWRKARLYPRFLADYLYMEPRPPRSVLAALRGDEGDAAVTSPMINVNVLQALFKPDADAVRSSSLRVRRVDGGTSANEGADAPSSGSWENDSINCYVVDRGQGRPVFRIETACLSPSGAQAFVAALREAVQASVEGEHA